MHVILHLNKDIGRMHFQKSGQLFQRVYAVFTLSNTVKLTSVGVCQFSLPPTRHKSASVPTQAASDFWVFANLIGEKWSLCALLICFFLTLKEVEHPFTCLWAIRISFSLNCVLVSLDHFSTDIKWKSEEAGQNAFCHHFCNLKAKQYFGIYG